KRGCEVFQLRVRPMMAPQQPGAAGAGETLLLKRCHAGLAQSRVPRQPQIVVGGEIDSAGQCQPALPVGLLQPLQFGGNARDTLAQWGLGTDRGPNSTD